MKIIQDGKAISITIIHTLPGICSKEWMNNNVHKFLLQGDDLLKDRDFAEFLEVDSSNEDGYREKIAHPNLGITTLSLAFLRECVANKRANNISEQKFFVATSSLGLVKEFVNNKFSDLKYLQVKLDSVCLTIPVNYTHYTLCLNFDPATGEKIDVKKKPLTSDQNRRFLNSWNACQSFSLDPIEEVDGKTPNRDGFPEVKFIRYSDSTSMASALHRLYKV